MNKNKLTVGSAMLAAAFLIYQENVKNYVYSDPIGIPTWCAGETQITLGKKIEVGKTYFSDQECSQILEQSLQKYNKPLETLNYELDQGPHIAFLDFTYNSGEYRFNHSGMMRYLRQGNVPGACDYLLKYKYAQGYDCSKSNKCAGVWRRRLDEWQVCTKKISVQDFLFRVGKLPKHSNFEETK